MYLLKNQLWERRKPMKKMTVCLSMIMFWACASIPEYDTQNSALLIGKIIHQGKNHDLVDTLSLSGTHLYGIQIVFLNLDSNQSYTLISMHDGFFYSTKLPQGKYQLKKLFLRIDNREGSYTSTSASTNSDSPSFFEIKSNKINNLGKISWMTNGDEDAIYNFNNNYAEALDLLKNNFPKSQWLFKDTANVKMGKPGSKLKTFI
jgi:hypothetical protein